MKSRVFLLSFVTSFCAASVDFTHSTLYDINDFIGQAEVRLTKCDNGCLIFASTMGCGFVQSPSDYDPYAEKLIINDNNNKEQKMSITDLSKLNDKITGQKTPLTISGPQASISVLNLNGAGDASFAIALYVIEKSKAAEIGYEIYDVLNMDKAVTVDAGITTVMCAEPFTVTAKSSTSKNSVTARLVGFDNVLDSNTDDCPVAYSTDILNPFPGATLFVAGPIVSMNFNQQAQLEASMQFIPAFDLGTPGFVTSGGYNGCRKPNSGGVQSFRSSFLQPSDIYTLDTNDNDAYYDVTITVEPTLDEQHKLTVHDVIHNDGRSVYGYTEEVLKFHNTDYINIVYNNFVGDQGFLLRYSAVLLESTKTTPLSTSTTSQSSTTQMTTITTSGSGVIGAALLPVIAAFALLLVH